MVQGEELKRLLEGISSGMMEHVFYWESIEVKNEIAATFSETYPKFLEIDRPKETKAIKEYRKKIFQNPVLSDLSRIMGKVSKIPQAEGFSVNFMKSASGENQLKDYTEELNNNRGLLDWFFNEWNTAFTLDPNSVVAVIDKNPPETETVSQNPKPYIFDSEDVIDFVADRYCVLRDGNDANSTHYLIDDTYYYIISRNEDMSLNVKRIEHKAGFLPYGKVGKYIKERKGDEVLYKSIISDAIPHFRSAIRRYNDQEVEFIHHINTLEWQMARSKCKRCKGSGKMGTKDGSIKCEECNGSGLEQWDELNKLLIEPKEFSFLKEGYNFPFTSPGGYVPRNIAAVKAIEGAYGKHLDEAYNAIDFGVLRPKTFATHEAVMSKRMDREEYDAKIYDIAQHLVFNAIIPAYRGIDALKFGREKIVEENKVFSRIPKITIPTSYTLTSADEILDELKIAKEAGVSYNLTSAMLIKYANNRLGKDSIGSLAMDDEIALKPFGDMTVEEIELMLGGGEDSATNLVSLRDAILYANWKSLYKRAERDHTDWFAYELQKKHDILYGYVDELIKNKELNEKEHINTLDNFIPKKEMNAAVAEHNQMSKANHDAVIEVNPEKVE